MAAKQQRGLATIHVVLDAALALVSAGEALSAAGVAARSHVSIGSIYHHFGSLPGVAAALYERCLVDLLDTMLNVLAGDPPAREGVEGLARAYLAWTAANPDAARFVHLSTLHGAPPPVMERLAHEKGVRLAAMGAWLAPKVSSGEVVSLPMPLYEMLLIGPLAETARRWLVGAPEIDIGAAATLLPPRIWASVAGPGSHQS